MSSSSNILPRKSLLQGILHSSIILDSLPRVGLIFVSSSGILVFTCVCHRLPVSAFTRLLLTTMTATSTVLRMSGLLPQRIVVLQQGCCPNELRLLGGATVQYGVSWLPRHRSTGHFGVFRHKHGSRAKVQHYLRYSQYGGFIACGD